MSANFADRLREFRGLLDPLVLLSSTVVLAYCYWVGTAANDAGEIPGRDAFLAGVALTWVSIFATNRATRQAIAEQVAEEYRARLLLAREQGLDSWYGVNALQDAIDIQRRQVRGTPEEAAVIAALDALAAQALTAEQSLSTTYQSYTLIYEGASPSRSDQDRVMADAEKSLRRRKAIHQKRLAALLAGDTGSRTRAEQASVAAHGLDGLDIWTPKTTRFAKPHEVSPPDGTTGTGEGAAT